MKSKKMLRNRNQNHNELYTTPSTIGGCCIFYTDEHNVDEDEMTISSQGGFQAHGNKAGITYRNMLSIPSNSLDVAASRLIYLS